MSSIEEMAQKRQNLLLPTIEELRERLQSMDGRLLATRAGAEWSGDHIRLELLGQAYVIDWPEAIVRPADEQQAARADIAVLLLTYLSNADGTPPAHNWVSFRELPDGGFYHRAFQGYAPDRLAQRFGDDIDAFRRAAKNAGGRREAMGDASYSFRALPQIWLAAVLWRGDEEFPAAARMLFDQTSKHYLATDLLATLGRMVVSAILKAAPEKRGDAA